MEFALKIVSFINGIHAHKVEKNHIIRHYNRKKMQIYHFASFFAPNFEGVYKSAKREARVGRNPATGAELKIPASIHPSLKRDR